MAKSYTAYSRNVSNDMQKLITAQNVELPAKLMVELELTMESEGFEKITKNPVWMAKVADLAKKHADDLIKDAAKVIDAEAKKGKLTPKMVEGLIDVEERVFDKELCVAVDAMLQKYVNDKKEYTKYKIKIAAKIVLGGAVIVASAVTSAASLGAASPVAVIAMTRSCVALAQTVLKAAAEAEHVERLLRVDKTVLEKVFKANEGAASKNVKETALNFVSGLLSIDTPAASNFADHVALYRNKITGLSKAAIELGKGVNKMMDAAEAFGKKVDAIKKDKGDEDPKVKKAMAELDKQEKELDKVLTNIVSLNERVNKQEELCQEYEKAAAAIKKGVSKWTEISKYLAGFAINPVGIAHDVDKVIAASHSFGDEAKAFSEVAQAAMR